MKKLPAMDGCGELIVTAWEGDCSRHQIRHLMAAPHCAAGGKENDGIFLSSLFTKVNNEIARS